MVHVYVYVADHKAFIVRGGENVVEQAWDARILYTVTRLHGRYLADGYAA